MTEWNARMPGVTKVTGKGNGVYWISIPSGHTDAHYNWWFHTDQTFVTAVKFDRGAAGSNAETKRHLDRLKAHEGELEKLVGETFFWETEPNRRAAWARVSSSFKVTENLMLTLCAARSSGASKP